ncbi:MAG TPA: phosphotransferase [Micromonospora sp.]
MRQTEWALAQRWITEQLERHGTPATGPAVVERERPWATVARVPVAGGQVWFKCSNRGTGYEAGLARILGRLVPERVLTPIAVAPERGWQLLPDGGPTLREACGGRFEVEQWERLLRDYAELQRTVSGQVDELLAAGVPDVRPPRLPELFAGLLTDEQVVRNVDPERLAALRAWQPRIERRCARLTAAGIAPSIQHDDLHTGNVFADGSGTLRFFDFGDASVAHPFGTMLVALRVVADQTGVPHGDRLLHRLRDTYLTAWADGRDLAELRRLCQDAIVVTKVSKALSYQRALVDAGPDALAEWGGAVHGWLTELLGPDVV